MALRIYLTGGIAVEVEGTVVLHERQLRARQGRLLFAYLVCQRTRGVPQEELAQVIWPQQMPPAWGVALSALFSRLRKLFSTAPFPQLGVSLVRGYSQYQLLFPSDAWVDIEETTRALDEAEGALRGGEAQRVLGPAAIVTNIARRSFLPGIEGEWVESQRRKLERQLLRGQECLAEMWLAMAEPRLAIEAAEEATRLDVYREESCRLLMRAYAAGGNLVQAVQVYHRFRSLLADEIGTSPTPETEALYLRLLG